jgi:hypothetical protein
MSLFQGLDICILLYLLYISVTRFVADERNVRNVVGVVVVVFAVVFLFCLKILWESFFLSQSFFDLIVSKSESNWSKKNGWDEMPILPLGAIQIICDSFLANFIPLPPPLCHLVCFRKLCFKQTTIPKYNHFLKKKCHMTLWLNPSLPLLYLVILSRTHPPPSQKKCHV